MCEHYIKTGPLANTHNICNGFSSQRSRQVSDGHFSGPERDENLFSSIADPSFFAPETRPPKYEPTNQMNSDDTAHRFQTAPRVGPRNGTDRLRLATNDPRLDPDSQQYDRRLAMQYVEVEQQRKMAQQFENEKLRKGDLQRRHTRQNELGLAQANADQERHRQELEHQRRAEVIRTQEQELDRLESLLRANPNAAIPGLDLADAKNNPDLLSEALRHVEASIARGAPPTQATQKQPVRRASQQPQAKQLDAATEGLIMDFLVASNEEQDSWLSHIPTNEGRLHFLRTALALAPSATAHDLKERFGSDRSNSDQRGMSNKVTVHVTSPSPKQDTEPMFETQPEFPQQGSSNQHLFRPQVREPPKSDFSVPIHPNQLSEVPVSKSPMPLRRNVAGHPGQPIFPQRGEDVISAAEMEEESIIAEERAAIERLEAELAQVNSSHEEDVDLRTPNGEDRENFAPSQLTQLNRKRDLQEVVKQYLGCLLRLSCSLGMLAIRLIR